jgi:hypothetical protein
MSTPRLDNATPAIPEGGRAITQSDSKVVSLDPARLIAKAIEHAVPVETLERLLAMRTALVAEAARAEFFRALSAFQARIPQIPKRQLATTNKFQYCYANLSDIQSAIAPALCELGLSVAFDTSLSERLLTVIARVHHAAGHSESTTFAVPFENSARMSPAQAMGSALTYARRYALCAALGIVTAEDDDDGRTSQPQSRPDNQPAPPGPIISAAQHRRLEARINDLGLDRARVKTWVKRAWGIDHLSDIPASKYSTLDHRLDVWADASASKEEQAEREAIQAEGCV